MSSVSNADASAHARELTVVSWPLIQEPGRAMAVFGGMLLLAGYALFSTASWGVAMLALLLLMSSGWRLWIPVRFELGPRGVVQRVGGRQRRIPWRDFSGYELRRRGAFLFADDRPGPLAFLGAWFIRYPDPPERLRELLELYLAPRRSGAGYDDLSGRSSRLGPARSPTALSATDRIPPTTDLGSRSSDVRVATPSNEE